MMNISNKQQYGEKVWEKRMTKIKVIFTIFFLFFLTHFILFYFIFYFFAMDRINGCNILNTIL